MRKKIFITGISGFAGTYLTEYLLKTEKYEISGTYISDNIPEILTKNPVQLFQVNLTDAEKIANIVTSEKPDVIVHLAALTSAAKSFENPSETLLTNIQIQMNILEVLRKNNMLKTRMLLISSADAYGLVSKDDLPIDEETPFRPTNPYAVSKVTQDYLGYQYALAYNLDIIRVRPFNHIGPAQAPQFVVSSFAKQIAEIEKGKKEPIIQVGNLANKRDFTDVRDVVKAYEGLVEKGEKGEVYNVGSGKSYKIADILDMLLSFSITKIEIKVDTSRLRPIDDPELLCDNTKLVQTTGWKPTYSLEQTLKDTLDYWRNIV